MADLRAGVQQVMDAQRSTDHRLSQLTEQLAIASQRPAVPESPSASLLQDVVLPPSLVVKEPCPLDKDLDLQKLQEPDRVGEWMQKKLESSCAIKTVLEECNNFPVWFPARYYGYGTRVKANVLNKNLMPNGESDRTVIDARARLPPTHWADRRVPYLGLLQLMNTKEVNVTAEPDLHGLHVERANPHQ